MKYVLPALVAVVCALAACKTTADRFDLFAPDKPQGMYTEKLRAINFARGSNRTTVSTYAVAANAAQQPPEAGPIAPPPPPPPPPPSTSPETEAGAPAATPMPETTMPGTNAPPTEFPGTSAPVTTPSSGSQPSAVPLPAPAATPAPAAPLPEAGASPAPVIPGLSQ